jgi:hypothetical protein
MKGILTPQEKKFLRFMGKYLNSYGMTDGLLESEGYDEYEVSDLTEIDVTEWTHFANNYSVEVPEQLHPILKKLLENCQKRYNNIDVETNGNDINYARFSIDIDTEKQEISVNYWYTWYDTADSQGSTFDESDGESVIEVLNLVQEVCDGYNEVELRYNGGEDSGYVESTFEEPSESVPAHIDDYCYKVLEDLYGGWEINEGSQGSFYFDLKNKQIRLEHQYNTEESNTFTLYEENYSK